MLVKLLLHYDDSSNLNKSSNIHRLVAIIPISRDSLWMFNTIIFRPVYVDDFTRGYCRTFISKKETRDHLMSASCSPLSPMPFANKSSILSPTQLNNFCLYLQLHSNLC